MSITLDLSPEVTALLECRAAEAGMDLTEFALQTLNAVAEVIPKIKPSFSTDYIRPTTPPAWLDAIKPLNPPTDGTNGLHRIIGKWPGDETDEQIREALEALS